MKVAFNKLKKHHKSISFNNDQYNGAVFEINLKLFLSDFGPRGTTSRRRYINLGLNDFIWLCSMVSVYSDPSAFLRDVNLLRKEQNRLEINRVVAIE